MALPKLDQWDWEGCAERNREYLDTDKIIKSTIYTGFFERLISLVGFEDAAVSLVDEEMQEAVHRLFDRLADLYIELAAYMKKYFRVEWIEFHDDWGNQRSLMFSEETYREMIKPYVKKTVDGFHSLGIIYEQHSCGKIDRLIPDLIETGADTWRGQKIVDKKEMVEKYGSRFRFGVSVSQPGEISEKELKALIVNSLEPYRDKQVWFEFHKFTPEQKSIVEEVLKGDSMSA